jgi:hypothetical protein
MFNLDNLEKEIPNEFYIHSFNEVGLAGKKLNFYILRKNTNEYVASLSVFIDYYDQELTTIDGFRNSNFPNIIPQLKELIKTIFLEQYSERLLYVTEIGI